MKSLDGVIQVKVLLWIHPNEIQEEINNPVRELVIALVLKRNVFNLAEAMKIMKQNALNEMEKLLYFWCESVKMLNIIRFA